MKEALVPFQMVDEYTLILYLKLQHFLHPLPPPSWQVGDRGDVVLIPGVAEYWNFLQVIGDFLNQRGYRVHTIPSLEDNTLPLTEASKIAAEAITDYPNPYLVSHSKGGLIALNLLIDPKVKLSVSISTPYHGSNVAKLMSSSAELSPESPTITQLDSLPIDRHKIISIYPSFDNHVLPHSGLILAGAENHQLDVVGHTRILTSPQTLQLLSQIL